MQLIIREDCTVQDISFVGGTARMTFLLKDGELLERTIRSDEVVVLMPIDLRISVLLPTPYLIIIYMAFAILSL